MRRDILTLVFFTRLPLFFSGFLVLSTLQLGSKVQQKSCQGGKGKGSGLHLCSFSKSSIECARLGIQFIISLSVHHSLETVIASTKGMWRSTHSWSSCFPSFSVYLTYSERKQTNKQTSRWEHSEKRQCIHYINSFSSNFETVKSNGK